ncbi:heptaprenyl diphosphate synthase [Thermosipho melanesiensis]|uniref:Heptaprenyl diphosphate synthase component I n=2 Tax=Thermosipho melanesiensis TaxID=46541 RepID=A6LJI6_THEM4|nr:Heptaprenyl diphosphate synthase component I [Thermosipho melanesiensis BI429]APT73284.1 heptaprenyl diphosphate synthase [Thermosipho melanesiensis]OOC38743.1 heptaprenyl diphosphate synthase [Thermosipho melanesiensis]OOC40548.1 heptaprenyl diphosphate synthase [Thermosipho melanesiensis]OOC40811.1 heptaprenyl diphosphate synthase [Thermosipho melanesiensis]
MVIYALLISLSSVMFVIERYIPYPVPAGKWGFSNFVVLYTVLNFGLKGGLLVGVLKTIIGSIFTGTIFSPAFFMGFFGILSAIFIQWLISKLKFFGYSGISIIGMISNNTAQVFVGSIIINSNAIFSFLPIMVGLGLISAIINALLAKKMEEIFDGYNLSD